MNETEFKSDRKFYSEVKVTLVDRYILNNLHEAEKRKIIKDNVKKLSKICRESYAFFY